MLFEIPYGDTSLPLEYDPQRTEILAVDGPSALTDVEIGEAFDHPIDSPPLDEIVRTGETVLIVVPDATRRAAAGQIVNLVVRRLIAGGTRPYEIAIIFATGIHRNATPEEKAEIVTPFIAQRVKMLDHSPRDLMRITGVGDQNRLVQVGELRDGSPIELNRVLLDFDRTIIVGGVNFHYFAGFGGGRKMICPGLASAATTAATHRLAFDFEKLDRAEGVETGRLDGNPVHEAFVEAVKLAVPSFSINTIVNSDGAAAAIYCGDWQTAHRAACDGYAASHTIEIRERRPLVIVSAGGPPFDINLIQAHKALDAAAAACEPGGTIILAAECRDGTGRGDFIEWFSAANSEELAEDLARGYKVNGQTAWSLLKKAEKFDVRLVSALDAEAAAAMRLSKYPTLDSALAGLDRPAYLIPQGSRVKITSA